MSMKSWLQSLRKSRVSSNRKEAHRRGLAASPRHACFEPLEDRRVLAALSDGGGTTLEIELAANESLTVVSNGTTYAFGSNQAMVNAGVADSGDFSGFGGTSLILESSGLARYDTISIVDAPGASLARVTFKDSGVNSYSDHVSVTLDEPFSPPNFFHPLTFNGATSFSDTNSLFASSNMTMEVNAGASITTVDGDIHLESNQQAVATVGNGWVGIVVTTATIGSSSGDITLEGRGGVRSSGNIGVWLASNAVVGAGTTGLVTVRGIGGNGAGVSLGVRVTASEITSGGGNVIVDGQGGGGGNSTGVAMDGNGVITAGGTGTVYVEGTGGDNSAGVGLNQATITSNGGSVTVLGTGGSAGAGNVGIRFSGTITAGANADVHVTGIGGNNNGFGNVGVDMRADASVRSSGGDVFVTGIGGGDDPALSGGNIGVQMFPNATIKPGGNGKAEVVGKGGAGSQGHGVTVASASSVEPAGINSSGGNVKVTGTAVGIGHGVFLNGFIRPSQGGTPEISAGGIGNVEIVGIAQGQGSGFAAAAWSEVTSSGGNISIDGTGGSIGDVNYGVVVSGVGAGPGFTGLISAGVGGDISIVGRGGNSGGVRNDGVRLGRSSFGNNAEVLTNGGDITVTGIAGTGTLQTGIGVSGGFSNGLLSTSNGGDIFLNADLMDLRGPIHAETRTVTLKPQTTDGSISANLGGADSATELGLFDLELDQVTAGTINIGAANSAMTVSSPITRLTATDLNLTGSTVSPAASTTDLSLVGGTLAFGPGSDVLIEIAGTVVNTDYDQLNVEGTANLSNVDLLLTGAFTSGPSDVFVVVAATAVTGNFNGLPENATIVFNGRSLRVNYSPTTVTLTDIGPSNQPPVITSDGAGEMAFKSIDENTTAVTDVNASDPDAETEGGGGLTYSLSGPDAALFSIDANGNLAFSAAPDFESPGDVGSDNVYDVTVTVTDTGLETDEQAIAVTVTDVNEAPSITSDGGGSTASKSIDENTTAVTDVNASDPEGETEGGGGLAYSLSGLDAALFTIDANGNLAFATAPDFEAPGDVGGDNVYDVTVTVTDTGLESVTQDIAVTVTNVNEDPSITSDGGGATVSKSIDENTTAVTDVNASDPDGETEGGGGLTYSLSGPDATAFSIDANGILAFTAAPDFESPGDVGSDNVYDVIVTVTDSGVPNLSDSQTISVSVLNVQATISGTVFMDADGDGLFDGGTETALDNVTIELLDSALALLATDTTELGGVYAFTVDDEFASYRIRETTPTGVDEGAAILGTAGGTVINENEMDLVLSGDDASEYDFTETGQAVQACDTATIGFWQNKHGQALIKQGGDTLVTWLSTNFGNIFGDTFSDGSGGDNAAEVANFYKYEFFKANLKGTSKVDAQFMATALATFFTSSNLSGGSVAASYGFNVTETGIGTNVVNVGDNGAAFGVADNANMTIMASLLATNNLTGQADADASENYSHVYDANGDGVLDNNEKLMRAKAHDVYVAINENRNDCHETDDREDDDECHERDDREDDEDRRERDDREHDEDRRERDDRERDEDRRERDDD
ncbi:MAG: cadherin repeat domain-containing protein [Planctomycetales bacterium]|nr:cadherin repeat domain-containing protein [Planctomycetales bacterium]